MTDSSPPAAVSARAFWTGYAIAWLGLWGLIASEQMAQQADGPSALLIGFLVATAPALPGILLARRRHLLLPVGITRARFFRKRILEGILYMVTVSGLLTTTLVLIPIPEGSGWEHVGWEMFFPLLFTGGLLYVLHIACFTSLEAIESLQESRAQAARESVLRAEAEAKAIRAQFNPHFVFNTLHSLMVLVRAEPETAETAIEDVAELIRYASTLQRKQVDRVTLAKELDFARRYLALEELRLSDRLTVEWAIEEGLDDVLVPAFSLQTLLENAIKHGIATKPEGGRIRIAVTESNAAAEPNGRLHLSVTDDGLGTDPETVDANGGSGLTLMRRRLEHIYAGDAHLQWETAPGEGFTATVELPVRRAP